MDRPFGVLLILVAALVAGLYFLGRRKAETLPSPGSTPPPATFAPASPPLVAATPPPSGLIPRDRSADMKALAQAAGVTITRLERTGLEGVIEVEWIGDVMTVGVDFIESLLRQGIIRDFEPIGRGLSISMTPDGRRLLKASFKIFF